MLLLSSAKWRTTSNGNRRMHSRPTALPGLRAAACLTAVLAFGWLIRLVPPRFLPNASADPVRAALVLMFVLNGLEVYVLLVLRRFLAARVRAANPGQYLVALAALFATGALASAYLLLSGLADQPADLVPNGPYLVLVAYLPLSQLAVGALLIAFGYSVLRSIPDRDAPLRRYAHTQLAAGVGLSSMVFAPLAALAMGAGHLILAAAFWKDARPARAPQERHAFGHGTPA